MENKGNSEIRWLNEYSKAYLENGYLVNGETVEQRLKFIADRAGKKFLIKNDFQRNFLIIWKSDIIHFLHQFGQIFD